MTFPLNFAYPDWKAPTEDGEFVVWPGPVELENQTRENLRHLTHAQGVLLQNIPLATVRSAMRKWVGHDNPEQPLVMTGHQTELHHPGVWVKNILIDKLASKLGGAAYHLAVDTDEPKHLDLRWPGGSSPITDDTALRSAAWSALVAPPTPNHLFDMRARFKEVSADWDFEASIVPFFDSMQRLLLDAENLPTATTNALHQLDWSLGLRHHALLASPIFGSEPYLTFVHHLMASAGNFAADYNAALADYRQAVGIRSPGRPMPDLRRAGDTCESPFWLDQLSTGRRERATLVDDAGVWMLEHAGDAFRFEATVPGNEAASSLLMFLRRHNLRLAPRALTLTMFARLLLADQFVHGIGGGRYDQVTDRLIARHFNLQPPRFSVATCTLYFPSAVGRSRACFPCILEEGHHLRHSLLGSRKREMVQQIETLPRHSFERREVFSRIHRELAGELLVNPTVADWEKRREQSEKDMRYDAMLFDRELFYAIQPRHRLEAMIANFT